MNSERVDCMEHLPLAATNFFMGVLCLALGLIVHTGKANGLIAGYNTMSEKEKAKWNEKAMSKATGWVLIISSAVLLIACIPMALNFYPVTVCFVSWGMFTVIIIAGVIYINVSPRFKRMSNK